MRGLTIVSLVAASTAAPSHDLLTPGRVMAALAWTILACIPIGLSLWALLDVVHRPQWAWALSPYRQVAWLIVIVLGVFTVVVGLAISLWYLLRIRPVIAGIERGDLGVTSGGPAEPPPK